MFKPCHKNRLKFSFSATRFWIENNARGFIDGIHLKEGNQRADNVLYVYYREKNVCTHNNKNWVGDVFIFMCILPLETPSILHQLLFVAYNLICLLNRKGNWVWKNNFYNSKFRFWKTRKTASIRQNYPFVVLWRLLINDWKLAFQHVKTDVASVSSACHLY